MLINLYRFANLLYRLHIPIIPKVIYYIQYLMFNSSVPASVKMGKGTKFAYGGIALVIHARTEIGENCIVGQCCTIGGRSKQYNVPKIGDNVYIGAGAKVLGPVVIGSNVVIGAGSVVLSNIPSNSVVAGVPAKIIKTNINTIYDFI